MSTEIDERVVALRLENDDFERDVKKSMSTIDEFDKKLKMEHAAEGFEKLQKSADNLDLEKASRNLGLFSKSFSELPSMVALAVHDAERWLLDYSKSTAKMFTIEPVSTGFSEYELKMGSVQTIMAGTGESLETVMGYLEDLNEYSDKTIYSFQDMTSNIGKFTNSGVKLEDAVLAMKGISNEAAISGANANEASRAMYNLAQSISMGYVQYIDWKSIENANMATVSFKEELAKTAVELGGISKASENTYLVGSKTYSLQQLFKDGLKDQWLTTEALIKTLGKYADETTDIGKRAYAAATEVKTFSMMMDTLKEAAQSGWATTWELLIGDFTEAKDFFTRLSTMFDEMISSSADARNEFFRTAFDSRWVTKDQMIDLKKTGQLAADFNDILAEVAKEHGINIEELTKKYKTFYNTLESRWLTADIFEEAYKRSISRTTEEVKRDVADTFEDIKRLADEVIEGQWGSGDERERLLREAGHSYAAVQDYVNHIILGSHYAFEDYINDIEEVTEDTVEFAKETYKGSEAAEAMLTWLKAPEGSLLLQDSIINAVEAIRKFFGAIKSGIMDGLFGNFTGDMLYNAIANFREFTARLIISDEAAEKIRTTLSGVFSIFRMIGSAVKAVITGIGTAIKTLLGVSDFSFVGDSIAFIGTQLQNVHDWFVKNEIASKIAEKVADTIILIGNAVRGLYDKIANSDFVGKIVDGFQAFVGGLSNKYGPFKEAISLLVDKLRDLKNLDLKSIASTFTDFIRNILGSFVGFDITSLFTNKQSVKTETQTSIFDSILEFFKPITDYIGEHLGSMLSSGISIALVVSLSKIAKSLKSLNAIPTLIETFKSVTSAINGIGEMINTASKTLKSAKFLLFTRCISSIAKAILMVVGALAIIWLLYDTNDPGKLWGAVGIMAVIMVALTAMYSTISFIDSKIPAAGTMEKHYKALYSIGMSLMLMSVVLKIIDGVSWGGIAKTGLVMAALTGMYYILTFLANKFNNYTSLQKTIKSIQQLSVAILILSITATICKHIGDKEIGGLISVSVIAIALLFISELFASFSKAKFEGKKVISTLSSISKAILILAAAAIVAGFIKPSALEKMWTLVLQVVALIAAIGYFGEDLQKANNALKGLGLAILALSAALWIINALPLDGIGRGLLVVTALSVILGAFVYFTNGKKMVDKAATTFMAMGVALLLAATSILIVSGIKPIQLLSAAGAIGVIALVLGIVARLAKDLQAKASSIIALGGVLLLVAVSISILSMVPWDQLTWVTGSLVLVVLSLAALTHALGRFTKESKVWGPMLAVATALLLVGGILYTLSTFVENSDLVATAAAVSLLLITLAASVFILSKISETRLQNAITVGLLMAGLSFACLLISASLNMIENPKNVIKKAVAIGAILVSMAAVFWILAKIPLAAIGSVAAFSALIFAFIGVFALLVAALGYMYEKVDWFRTGIDALGTLASLIGGAIGTFVGSIIDGYMNAATMNLDVIAERLVSFGETIKPFIDQMAGVDTKALEGLGKLVDMFILLGAASFIDALISIFDKEKLFRELKTTLGHLADMTVSFANKLSGITNNDIERTMRAATTIEKLFKVFEYLPREGGFQEFIFGKTDLDAINTSLPNLAEALKTFLSILNSEEFTLTDDEYNRAINAADILSKFAEMTTALDRQGGWSGEIFGENISLKTFSEQIPLLATGLRGFIDNLGADFSEAYNADNVSAAVTALDTMAELAGKLPTKGGLWNDFVAGNVMDLTTFGDGIGKIGVGLKTFNDNLGENFDGETVEHASSALVSLVTFLNAMAKQTDRFADALGDIVSFVFKPAGDAFSEYMTTSDTEIWNELPTFFEDAAKAINVFSNTLSINTDFERAEQASKALGPIAEFMVNYGVAISAARQVFGNDFDGLGGDIYKMAQGANEIAKLAVLFNDEQRDTALTFVSSLFKLAMVDADKKGVAQTTGEIDMLATAVRGYYDILTGIPEDAITKGNTIMSDFRELLATTDLSTVEDYRKEVQELGSTMKTLGDAVNSFAVDEIKMDYAAYKDTGAYLMEGLVLGITSKTFDAKTAAVALANEIVTAIEQEWMINTNFSVGYGLGSKFADSVAVGILDSSGGVRTAIYDTAQNSVDTFGNALRNVGKAEYAITPVIDISNLADNTKVVSKVLNSGGALKANLGVQASYVFDSTAIDGMTSQILGRLDRLEAAISNMSIVMDSGALVGSIETKIDKRLGIRANYRTRGI